MKLSISTNVLKGVLFATVLFCAFSFAQVQAFTIDPGDGNPGCCDDDNSTPTPTPVPPKPPVNDDDGSDPAPVCESFTATPNKINKGETVTLKWQTRNANSVTILRINGDTTSHAVDGSVQVTPGQTGTFTLTAKGPGGTDTCAVKVTVVEPTPAPTCDSFTVTPANLPAGGGNVTLKWQTSNATKVTISGIGEVNNLDNTTGRSENVTATKTFTLTVFGADGKQDTCTAKVTVATPSPAPSCGFLEASPKSVVAGGRTSLNWDTTNATRVTIDRGVGDVPADGSKDVTVPSTPGSYTYTLTAWGANYQADTCKVTITVTEKPVSAVPNCDDISATPVTITKGQPTTIKWNTTNATRVVLTTPLGDQDVPADGQVVNSPTVSWTYKLTVWGANYQNDTCSVTVNVTDKPVATCDSLTATPSTIVRGSNSTLAWTTTNATRVVLTYLDPNGLSKEMTVDADSSLSVSPTANFTYILTAYGVDGQKNSCTIPVTVTTEQAPRCDSFTASPTKISKGESSTLTWDTTNVTSVSISNIGTVNVDGTASVSPDDTTTYELVGRDADNKTVSCKVVITVEEDEDDNSDDNDDDNSSGGSSSPKCELKISDKDISAGDRVTLTWETSNASEVTLKDSHGKTLMTTEDKLSKDKKDLYDGELTIRPEKDTTYTLIAEKGSKEKKCTVKVEVDGFTVITDNDQDLVGDIIISDLPYTGFEAGPMLTMLFYGVLLLWALYLAYILVIRRSGFGGNVAAYAAPTAPAPVFGEEMIVPSVTPATINPTPRFVAPAVTLDAGTAATIGYAAATRDTAYDAAAAVVEATAHAANVLLSSEAMRQFVAMTTETDRQTKLALVIDAAKASYPAEDGWVVVTGERMTALTATIAAPAPSFTPAAVTAGRGNSSLAEAMATGNIVAAYQLIGHRPMVALADAAAELDMLYRAKQGATVPVSTLLASATAETSAESVKAAIDALTGALDGTYTDEAEAVKVAILKSVKALS